MDSSRSYRYSQICVFIAGIVLVGILAAAVRTVISFRRASDAVLRMQEARMHFADALANVKEAGALTRTYLANGDEKALHERADSLADLNRDLAILRSRLAGRQLELLERFSALFQQLLAELDAYVDLRRNNHAAAIAERVATGEGKRLGDELRNVAGELQSSTGQALEVPIAALRSDTTVTLVVLGSGLALAALLVIAVFIMQRRDFRAREAAADALRRHAAEIQDLYNHAPCGYHSLDEEGRYIAINDTELSWLGYTRDEVLRRRRLADFLTPASREAFHEAFTRLRNGDVAEIREVEVELCRADGRVFPASLNGTVVHDARGGFVATRSTLFDLTERRRVEARLQELNATLKARGAELEAVNRELEAFSYSVSHDLRAPLRHIGYFAQSLQKHAGEKLDAKGQRCIETIAGSARNMGQLIDDLLSFARIARAEMRRTRVRLDEVVEHSRRALQTEINGRNIAWTVAPLPDVEGDAGLLRQAFANLLSNAVKYTQKCANARIEIAPQAGGAGEVVIVVRDNGAGFDMRFADKLFGVFQRLHSNHEFEGTGVGLANVRRIVERHGGRIWATAAVNEGASFFVALPAATTPATTTPLS